MFLGWTHTYFLLRDLNDTAVVTLALDLPQGAQAVGTASLCDLGLDQRPRVPVTEAGSSLGRPVTTLRVPSHPRLSR